MPAKLVSYAALLSVLALFMSCSGDVPPKGSHDAVKPAAIPASQQPSSAPPVAAAPSAPASSVSSQSAGSVPAADRSISIILQDESGIYAYDPPEITFAKGETVEIQLTSQKEFHTFTVDGLGIDVEVDSESTESLTFTFDKPGTYELICIPHESLGMIGTITVQ